METIDFDPYRFDIFWNAYDKKVGFAKCEAKYNKLTLAEKKKIFETLPQYIESTPDKQFRKNPETYLNNKSWNDEIIFYGKYAKQENNNITNTSQSRKEALAEYHNTNFKTRG